MLRDSIQTSNKYFKVLYGPLDHVFYITLHNRPYKNLVLFDDNFRQIRKIDVSHVSSFQSRCIHSQSTINIRNAKQTNLVTKYVLEIYFGSTDRNPLTFTTVSYKDCEILSKEIEKTFGVRVYSYGSLNTAFKNALKNASENEVITENYDDYRTKNEKYHLYKDAHDLKNLYELVQLETDEVSEPVAEISSNFPVVIEGNMEDGSFLSYRDIRNKNDLSSSVYKVEWYLSKSVGSNDEFFDMPSETSDTFYISEYMIGHFVMVKVYRALKFNENRTFVYSTAQRGPIYPNSLLCHHILINSTKKSDFHDALISTLDLDVLFSVVDNKNKFGVYQPFNAAEILSNFAYFQSFVNTTNNDLLSDQNINLKNKNKNKEENEDYNKENAVMDAENTSTQDDNNNNQEDFLNNIDNDVFNDENTPSTSLKYNNIRLKTPSVLNFNLDNNEDDDDNNNENDNNKENDNNNENKEENDNNNENKDGEKNKNNKLENNEENDKNKNKQKEIDLTDEYLDDNNYDDENEDDKEMESQDIYSEEDKKSLEFLYGKKTMEYYDDKKDLHEATTVSEISDSEQVKTFDVDEYFREDHKKKRFSIFNIFKSDPKKKALKKMHGHQMIMNKNNINKENKVNKEKQKEELKGNQIKEAELHNKRIPKDSVLLTKQKMQQMKMLKNKNNNKENKNKEDIRKQTEEDTGFESLEVEDGLERMTITSFPKEAMLGNKRKVKDSLLLLNNKKEFMNMFKKKNKNNNENNNGIMDVYVDNVNNNTNSNFNKENNIKNNKQNKTKQKKVVFNRKYEKQLKMQKLKAMNYNSPSSNSEVDKSEVEDDSGEEYQEDNKQTENNNNQVQLQNKKVPKDSILLMKEKQQMKLLKNKNKNKDENKEQKEKNKNKHKEVHKKTKGKKVVMDRKYEKNLKKQAKKETQDIREQTPTSKKKGGFLGFVNKMVSPKSKVDKLYPKPKNDMAVKKNKEEMNLEKFMKYVDTIQFVPVKLKICLNELIITFGLCSLSLNWKLIDPEKSDMLAIDQFPSIQKQLDSRLFLVYNSIMPIKIVLRTQSTFQRNVLYHSIIFNKYRTNYSIDRCERELENCYYNGVRTAYTKVCRSLYESSLRNEDGNKKLEELITL